MRAARLQDALERLAAAIRDVESELAAMKAEHDPLASHIFVSRRYYRNVSDTKSGKCRKMIARLLRLYQVIAREQKCVLERRNYLAVSSFHGWRAAFGDN
jgi:hypothetical protein